MEDPRLKKPRTARKGSRSKLDARLATLLQLGVDAFGPALDKLEASKMRRRGALAFLGGEVESPDAKGAPESATAPYVDVFLTVREPAGAAFERILARFANPKEKFHRTHTKLRAKAGPIATARVALADIPKLETDEDVVAVEWTGAFRPNGAGDTAPALSPRPSIGLADAPAAMNGKGVIVGIVDVCGLDLYHPAFVDKEGWSRILGIWDQRVTKPAAAPKPESRLPAPPYGCFYDRAAINKEMKPDQLLPGSVVPHAAWKGSHGTKTAGLAAGPAGSRPEARGVAPGADIVFVGTFGSGVGALGAMTELADALAFVFDVADAAEKPCVVNVSLGDDLGPRDGTSPVERFIDHLLEKPGRAVVIAAGNSGANGRHAHARFEEAKSQTLGIDVGQGNYDRAVVEIWYSSPPGSDAAIDIVVEGPGAAGKTSVVEPDGPPCAFDGGGARVLVASTRAVPAACEEGRRNGLVRLEILSLDEDKPLLAGIWKLHLQARGGVGEAHAWIDHGYIRFVEPAQDGATSVTTPGTASKAIVVGAYDPREKQVFDFSGRGPCRGPQKKPDLVAPGGPLLVASARTAVQWVSECGTSMAAPLVTGAVALLFQKHGKSLRSEEILAKLFRAGAAWQNADVGWGALDLAHWLEGAGAGAASPPAPGAQVSEEGVSPAEGRSAAPGGRDAAQIELGFYIVFDGVNPVAHVAVTAGTAPGHTVEHWLLHRGYKYPSVERPRVTLKFARLSGWIGSLGALKRFRTEGDTYVRAECAARKIGDRLPATTAKVEASSTETTGPNQRETDMSKKSLTRPHDAVQIELGVYDLIQSETTVGKLLVLPGTAPGYTQENWLLYNDYRWPSSDYPDMSIQFVRQSAPVTVASFLSGAPTDATYIVANCQITSLP